MKVLKVAVLGVGMSLLPMIAGAQHRPADFSYLRTTAAESSIIGCWIMTNRYKQTPHGMHRRSMQNTCSRAKRRTKKEVAQGKPPFGGQMPKFYQGKPEYSSPSFGWFFD